MNETEVRLRDYIPDSDYLAVKHLLEEAEMFDPAWDDEERLKQKSLQKPDTIIIAEINDEVVGSVYLVDDFFPFIFRLVVKDKYRRRGIGVKLMEETMLRAKQHGHTEVALFVDADNTDLQQWYRKLGFEDGGIYKSMWRKL